MGEYNIHGGFDKFMAKLPDVHNDGKDTRSKTGEGKAPEFVAPDFQTLEIEVGTRPCIVLEDRHSPASLSNLAYLKESILSHKSYEFIRSLKNTYYIAFPDKDHGASAAAKCYKSCIHGPFYNNQIRINLSQSGLHFFSPSGRLHWDPQGSVNGIAKSNSSPPVHARNESLDGASDGSVTAPRLRQSNLSRILNEPEASSNGHKSPTSTSASTPTSTQNGASDTRGPKRRKVTPWGGYENQISARHGPGSYGEAYMARDGSASSHGHVQGPVGLVFQHYRDSPNQAGKMVPVNQSPDPYYNTLRSPQPHMNPIPNGSVNGGYPQYYHAKNAPPLLDATQRMQHQHRQLWPKMSAPHPYHHYAPVPVPYAIHQGYVWNYANGAAHPPIGPPLPVHDHNYVTATPPSTTQTPNGWLEGVQDRAQPLPNDGSRASGFSSEATVKQKEREIVPASTTPSPESTASNKNPPSSSRKDGQQDNLDTMAADTSPSSFKVKMSKFTSENQTENERSSSSRGSLKQHELRTIKPYKAPSYSFERKETEKLGTDSEAPGKHYDLIRKAIESSSTGDLDANEISHWIMEHYPYYSNKYSFDMCLNSVSATLSQRKKKGDFIKHDPLPSSGNKRCRWSLSYRAMEDVDPIQNIKTPDSKEIAPEQTVGDTPPRASTISRSTTSRGVKIPSAQDYHVRANFTEYCHIVPSKRDITRWEDLHSLDAAKLQHHIFRPKDIVVIRPSKDDDPREFAIIRELKILDETSREESDRGQYIAASIFWYQSKAYSLKKAGAGRKLAMDWPEGSDFIRTNILDIVNLGALERKASDKELATIYHGRKILDAANNSSKIREAFAKEVAWTLRGLTSTPPPNPAVIEGRTARVSFPNLTGLWKENEDTSQAQSSGEYTRRRVTRSRDVHARHAVSAEPSKQYPANEQTGVKKQYGQLVTQLAKAYKENAALKDQLESEKTKRLEVEETNRKMRAAELLKQLPFFNQTSDEDTSEADGESEGESEMKRLMGPLTDESEWRVCGSLREALDSYSESPKTTHAPDPSAKHLLRNKKATRGNRRALYPMKTIRDRAQELTAMAGIKTSLAYKLCRANEDVLFDERILWEDCLRKNMPFDPAAAVL